jgi:hypothetical protein
VQRSAVAFRILVVERDLFLPRILEILDSRFGLAFLRNLKYQVYAKWMEFDGGLLLSVRLAPTDV